MNTRKGNYQACSSDAVNKAPISQSNMHDVWTRGCCCKSTPTRRPYRLASEKPQVNVSESSHLSMHDEIIAENITEGVETTLSVSETYISEMDSDEHDDVPLARLLRKWLFSNVEPTETSDPVTSVHSHENSSFKDIFAPTLGDSPARNEGAGQSE